MKVTVTQDHISNGKEKDSQHCMIADAIKTACPTAQFIQVDLQTIRFSDSKTRKRLVFLTPPVAQSGILKFDQGEAVRPFAFSLRQPVKARSMDKRPLTEKRRAQNSKADKVRKANKKKYAYLAANRARNHQREREFGLKKFVA